jgi:hypothetical protein
MASAPPSGAITSPLPERRKELRSSATMRRASRWRRILSVRHSLLSSMAARSRFPWYCSSLPSKRVRSEKESALAPAKPARILSL